MAREEKFSFKVLIKRESDAWVAHCLELNLIAVAETLQAVKKDILDVIVAHLDYALRNDNLEYMYHSAPREVWEAFLRCPDREEDSYRQEEPIFNEPSSPVPVIYLDNCFYRQACLA